MEIMINKSWATEMWLNDKAEIWEREDSINPKPRLVENGRRWIEHYIAVTDELTTAAWELMDHYADEHGFVIGDADTGDGSL